jgi:hypothetical protein
VRQVTEGVERAWLTPDELQLTLFFHAKAHEFMRNHRAALTVSVFLLTSCLLVGCSLPSPFAYPRFWDYTSSKPAETDLFGAYEILSARSPTIGAAGDLIRNFRNQKGAVITLNPDHTAQFSGLPDFDGFGQKVICSFFGAAAWELDNEINGEGGRWCFVITELTQRTRQMQNNVLLKTRSGEL